MLILNNITNEKLQGLNCYFGNLGIHAFPLKEEQELLPIRVARVASRQTVVSLWNWGDQEGGMRTSSVVGKIKDADETCYGV